MIDNYLAFIKKKLNSTNYLDYYDDIIDLLKINHQNIQNLLLNKDLNFENMKYYSKKKNKLLYEFINNKNFNNFICNLLNKIYDNNINYELNHNTLVNLKTKIPNINNNLRKEGIYIFPELLNKNKCEKILCHLNNKEYIDRTNNIIKNINLFNKNKNIWWINNYNDLLSCETIQQIITSDYLLNIAENYFKCKPILHNVLFWASYHGDVDTTQQFHQDFDDIKFLKIFIYLDDVNAENGPHVYVKNSLNNINKISTDNKKLSQRYDDELIKQHFEKDIIEICGKAGTMIFEDTHGLHKGTNVKKGKRFVLQLVYGVSPLYHLKNSNYVKYNCNINQHDTIYKAFLKFPYSYMNFTFHQ